MRPLVPPWISEIQPYEPGKPIEEVRRELGIGEPAKLASNENCLGPSPKAMAAVKHALDTMHLYPETTCYFLRTALADQMKIPPDHLVFGNGSHELLELAVRAFVFPDDEILTADMTFVVYKLAAQAAGRRLVQVPLKDMTYDLEAMALAITPQTKLIFIANPNNPTGTIVRREEFEKFLSRVPPDVVLVVDEAYFEFVQETEYPNSLLYHDAQRRILTMRTFSKIYGLAGLRVGYAIGDPTLVNGIEKIREVFSVNRMAQVAATAALDDTEHLKRTQDIVFQGLETAYEELDRLGIRYWKSHTNFVFVDFEKPAGPIYEAVLSHGVIIRPLPGPYARITTGTPEENKRLFAALSEVLDSC